jgi:hypothetical protein
MGLLRTILILVCVYYGFKLLMRLLAPFIMKKAAQKVNEKMNQQFGGQFHQEQQSGPDQEGKVVVERTRRPGAPNDSNLGEYVEFEDLKD